jgi:hypothetical protein
MRAIGHHGHGGDGVRSTGRQVVQTDLAIASLVSSHLKDMRLATRRGEGNNVHGRFLAGGGHDGCIPGGGAGGLGAGNGRAIAAGASPAGTRAMIQKNLSVI